jgi:hypothetical protein
MSKDYSITYWADGFARWHAKVTFKPALGNTPEAIAIFPKAEKKAKQIIRREIQERNYEKVRRLSYKLVNHERDFFSGKLISVTWSDKW